LELLKRKLEILGGPITEMDLIIHILHNLPEEYETAIKFIENELENDTATLERVKERLRTKYERIKTYNPSNERALVNRDFSKKYKGICSFCGIYGHKGPDFRKVLSHRGRRVNGENQPQGFMGICFKCNKKGHRASDCPTKQNQNSESMSISNVREISLIGAEGNNINPTLWIGDTGATSHMVSSDFGMFDAEATNQCVTVGDGRLSKM
jgi:DNA repair exonuclease SbcCD ATPase subunit